MDIVPNHTSDQHPWFLDAAVVAHGRPPGLVRVGRRQGGRRTAEQLGQQLRRSGVDLRRGDRSVLLPQPPAPSNRTSTGGTRRCAPRSTSIFRFWSDRGVAGFRIDVCNVIIKDAELRDNPPATEDDDFETQMFGQRSVYNANRPEVHEVIRRWRRLADGYDEPRLLIGETPVPVRQAGRVLRRRARRAGTGLQLQLHQRRLRAPRACGTSSRSTEAALPPGAWPAWTGSNHDMFRFPTRWAEDDPAQGPAGPAHAAEPARHPGALPGRRDRHGEYDAWPRRTCVIRSACASFPYYEGRDAGRTPMQWSDATRRRLHRPRRHAVAAHWGMSVPCNVASQRSDPTSVLALTRAPHRLATWRRRPAHRFLSNARCARRRLGLGSRGAARRGIEHGGRARGRGRPGRDVAHFHRAAA